MIDPQLIRRHPKYVIQQVHKKDPTFDVQKLIDLNAEVAQLQTTVEALRNKKNKLAQAGKQQVTQSLREQAKQIGQELKKEEQALTNVSAMYKDMLLRVPNFLLADVPAGTKEQNEVIKIVGTPPVFDFAIKNHVELGQINQWFDFDAATRIAGAHFALYKNEAVYIMYALSMFMLNNNIKHGFSPVLPPYLVNEASLCGASNFPRFTQDVYAMPADNLYLTPTAEVNLTALYRKAILSQQDLPIRLTAWTSCFRREAGGYGAVERGLIRMHQFEKLELYTVCVPESAAHEQERMLACAEDILQALGLHYRISLLAGQDCSFASAKTYDIEVWMPGQREYKEVSSISNCTDFQARRSQIRFKESPEAKTKFVYTLNGSSLALPRLLVALMETYQQADGRIAIPNILKTVCVPYYAT